MTRASLGRITTVVLGSFGFALGIAGCSDDAGPGGTVSVQPTAPLQVKHVSPAKIDARMRSVKWVGDVHNDAMRDWMENRGAWLGNDRSIAKRCAAVDKLSRKYTPALEVHAGISFTEAKRSEMLRWAKGSTVQCRQMSSMSIFGLPSTFGFARVAAQEEVVDGEGVTEEVFPYLDALEAAVNTTDGSPAAVNAATYGVLSTAGSLSEPNYQLLASSATVANSSAEVWQPYYGGGEESEERAEAMSIFGRAADGWGWVGADVAGCVGILRWAYQGNALAFRMAPWQVHVGACAFGAIVTSAVYAY